MNVEVKRRRCGRRVRDELGAVSFELSRLSTQQYFKTVFGIKQELIEKERGDISPVEGSRSHRYTEAGGTEGRGKLTGEGEAKDGKERRGKDLKVGN